MRLTFAIAFAFAISSALVSASAGNLLHLSANIPLRSDAYPSPRTVQVASRAQPQKCGTGGKVLEQNTIDHKGNTITHVSGTCPDGIGGSGNPPNALSSKSARMYALAATVRETQRYVTCEELSSYNIYVDDCGVVISYIESYARKLLHLPILLALHFKLTALALKPPSFGWSAYSFTLPPRDYAYWTYSTCTVTITNFDYIDYTVCYATLAYDAAATVERCTGVTAGAVCDGTQGAGQKWSIKIS
ncbi:hypothetical protein BC827DRAFT_1267867 [Russula dissimulans]|nr:hypothetical protein BC827DRAFT_1267867 [Russula dissimulans]